MLKTKGMMMKGIYNGPKRPTDFSRNTSLLQKREREDEGRSNESYSNKTTKIYHDRSGDNQRNPHVKNDGSHGMRWHTQDISRAQDIPTLQAIWNCWNRQFNSKYDPLNFNVFTKKLSTLRALDDPKFSSVLKEIQKNLGNFPYRELSNIAHNYADSHYESGRELLQEIGEEIVRRGGVQGFGGQSLNMLAKSYEKMNLHHQGIFDAIGREVTSKERNLRDFTSRDLAAIFYAYASLPLDRNAIYQELFAWIGEKITEPHSSLLAQCTDTDISCFIYAYEHSLMKDYDLCDKVIACLKRRLEKINLSRLNRVFIPNKCWITDQIAKAKTIEELEHICGRFKESFDEIHINALTGALSKFNVLEDQRFAWIHDRIQKNLSSFSPRTLSNLAYNYRESQQEEVLGVLHSIGTEVVRRGNPQDYDPVNLHMLIYAFTQSKVSDPGVFAMLETANMIREENLQSWASSDLATIAHTYALFPIEKRRDTYYEIFQKIKEAINVHQYSLLTYFKNPQDLVVILESYALSEENHPDLFEKIGNAIVANPQYLSTWNAQQLSTVVSAYATAGVKHSLLFQAIGDEIVRREGPLKDFMPRYLSNILHSFALMREEHPSLFGKIENEILYNRDSLEEFEIDFLSKIIHAYGLMHKENEALFAKIEEVILSRPLADFSLHSLSTFIYIYTMQEKEYPQLFQKLIGEIISRKSLKDFSFHDISLTLTACTIKRMKDPRFWKKITKEILSRSSWSNVKDTDLSRLLYSYAKLGIQEEAVFAKVQQELANRENLSSFDVKSLSSLAHAYALFLASKKEPGSLSSNPENFKYIGICLKIIVNFLQKKKTYSMEDAKQIALCAALIGKELPQSLLSLVSLENALNTPSQLERVVGYVLDQNFKGGEAFKASVDLGEKLAHHQADFFRESDRIAIEVDGTFHFDEDRTLNPETVLRNALYKMHGIKLVTVPYWEWDALPSLAEKGNYLKQKISVFQQ